MEITFVQFALGSFIIASFSSIIAAIVAYYYLILKSNSGDSTSKKSPESPIEDLADKAAREIPEVPSAPVAPIGKKYTPKRTSEDREIDSILVLFGSQTGTCSMLAERFAVQASEKHDFYVQVVDVKDYDPENLAQEKGFVVVIISTYEGGTAPEPAIPFVNWLVDMSTDFRVHKNLFENLNYVVFGVGQGEYERKFNAVGKRVFGCFKSLGAHPLAGCGAGDVSLGIEPQFDRWANSVWAPLKKVAVDPEIIDSLPKPIFFPNGNNNAKIKPVPLQVINEEEFEEDSGDESKEPLVDLEDLGSMVKGLVKKKAIASRKKRQEAPKAEQPKAEEQKEVFSDEEEEEEDESEEEHELAEGEEPREMVNPSLRKSLTKQGYRVLGSHSGVKLCRWTKAMLRGRGGCYKHCFYGITSSRCMEMTPSLACANKCVFCWRHHKNPVGTSWKWKVDDPEFLVESSVAQHGQMIKELKGLPGLRQDRFEEAQTIRHCALSLVGEPIIYPHINRFLGMLHDKNISTFLVTNAQFPEKIDTLTPVTQLYVSVDAATKESLKKIDRPLFEDFWERFLESFESLSRKGQRTVFRLTLVKEWNVEEVENYGQLVGRGKPDFVEIKGVTYCGTSKASTLRMTNVPFHHEVRSFASRLCETGPMKGVYEVASEHEHSCCILLAKIDKFKIEGSWHTWINYPKFHQLEKAFREAQEKKELGEITEEEFSKYIFGSQDYMAETPEWAVYGNPANGFNPEDTRFHRKSKPPTHGC